MALGIYVHLPFCPYICPYCDFAKWPMRRSASHDYLAALRAELASETSVPASTIFLGGGTPNAYDAATIAELIGELRAHFPAIAGDRQEISIEINPELVRDGDFERYVAAGIDRVSIGVQSFEAAEIATLGRKHTPHDVERAVRAARAAGIRSVSLDLIFAVPGQDARSWRRSLDTAIALEVDHISTYGLTVEAGTPYERWQAREPNAFFDDTREAEFYDTAIAALEGADFEHYEISNFARPGHRSRHNANYWANGEYVGLGVGAASYRGGARSVHTRDLDTYIAAASAGQPIPSETERLEGMAAIGEAIMLALRTAQGVELAGFKERYGIDVLERYAPVVAEYRDANALELVEGHLRLTRRGRFVANDVCGAFVVYA